jgi:pre-mRNA-splicing factor ISY1
LDEEDGSLLAYERAKEKEAHENFMDEGDEVGLDVEGGGGSVKVTREWVEIPGDKGDGVRWRVPTLDEVQEELVERRKRKLLDKLG